MGSVDINQNVIVSHHLHHQRHIWKCIPFFLEETFMEDHILRPVDAAKVPKNLLMLLDPSGLGAFFCSGNLECLLAASKFALLYMCFPSCCCWCFPPG